MNNTKLDEEELGKKEVLEKTLAGGQWFFLTTLVQRIVSLIVFFITARLLTPADFGLIALAGLIPALIDTHTAIGFEAALVQKREGEEIAYLDSTWTFNVLRAGITFIIVFFSAPFVAKFFHAPQAILLFQLSGLSVFIQGWTNIGQIYFSRNLEFKKFFIRDMSLIVSTSIVSIIGAYFFHSYWALFAGNTLGILIITLSTYLLHPYRPHFDFKLRKLRPLLGYSKWLFGQEILNQISYALENFMVGHVASTANMGLYGKAKSLAQAPTAPLSSIIGKINLSTYIKVRDSYGHVREGFYKSFELLACVGIPFLFAIYIAGNHIIHILLGDAWLDIIPILNILIIHFTLNAMTMTALPIFNALGEPRTGFRLSVLHWITMLFCLFLLVPKFGVFGASYSLLIATIVLMIPTMIFLHKLITISWWRVVSSLFVVIFSTIIPSAIGYLVLQHGWGSKTMSFLIIGTLLAMLYLVLIFLIGKITKKGPYQTLQLIMGSFFRKKFAI